MSRWAKATGAVVVLAVVAAGLAAATIVRHGVSAKDAPTTLEVVAARQMRHLAIPRRARDTKNPITPSAGVLAEARAHFADHCASCHGNDGKGRTAIGQNLYPKAPDMTLPATQGLSDGEIFFIIENGVRLTGMPAWGQGTAESTEDTWKLVHFIRRLPQLTPQELQEMKGWNPRSKHDLEEEEAERRFLAGEDVPPPTHGH